MANKVILEKDLIKLLETKRMISGEKTEENISAYMAKAKEILPINAYGIKWLGLLELVTGAEFLNPDVDAHGIINALKAIGWQVVASDG